MADQMIFQKARDTVTTVIVAFQWFTSSLYGRKHFTEAQPVEKRWKRNNLLLCVANRSEFVHGGKHTELKFRSMQSISDFIHFDTYMRILVQLSQWLRALSACLGLPSHHSQLAKNTLIHFRKCLTRFKMISILNLTEINWNLST